MSGITFSTAMISSSITAELGTISAQLHEAELTAITGLEISSPSDAPALWPQVDKLIAGSSDQALYQQNIDDVTSLYSVADSALDQVGNLLTRALEVAISMASETVDASSRDAAAIEIQALYDELVGLANTSYNDRTLFAGTAYSTDAYDASGTYLGSSATPTSVIGADQIIDAGFVGTDVFQGGVDLFATLDSFVTALTSNDVATIVGLTEILDDGIEQVNLFRSQIGYQWNVADDARLLSESLNLVMSERLTGLVAADPVEAYTELVNLQYTYEAAMQVAAGALSSSLFDFI